MIVIGVDAHTRTHTAAAVNAQTVVEVEVVTVAATGAGHREPLGGVDHPSDRRVGQLVGLLVEQLVVLPEVRPGQMPVVIFGLEVERYGAAISPLTASTTALTPSALRSVGVASSSGAG